MPPRFRAGAFFLLVLFLGTASGCATSIKGGTSRPVLSEPLDIMVRSDVEKYATARLGIFPFQAPPPLEGAVQEVTEAYRNEMVRGGVFRQVTMFPRRVAADEDAVWVGRREGCELVMLGSIRSLVDGTGALPTQLNTEIRILDVRTGREVWSVVQRASSNPGPDVDLYWTTFVGAPAQRYRQMARTLAGQFLKFLMESGMEPTK